MTTARRQSALISREPDAAAPAQWHVIGGRPPTCPFGRHRADALLDESARRLSHSELAVAETLVAEGHRVRALPERRGAGRNADLEVCGQTVEVKAWLPPGERGHRAPGARSVLNKLLAARDQGATAVLWARGSGLAARDADEGVRQFAASGRCGGITTVRVIGDGFDLAWGHRGPELEVARVRRPAPGPSPGGL